MRLNQNLSRAGTRRNRPAVCILAPISGVAILGVHIERQVGHEIGAAQGNGTAHHVGRSIQELQSQVAVIVVPDVSAKPRRQGKSAQPGINPARSKRGRGCQTDRLRHIGAALRNPVGAGRIRSQELQTRPGRPGHRVECRVKVRAESAPPAAHTRIIRAAHLDDGIAAGRSVLKAAIGDQFRGLSGTHKGQPAREDGQPHFSCWSMRSHIASVFPSLAPQEIVRSGPFSNHFLFRWWQFTSGTKARQ